MAIGVTGETTTLPFVRKDPAPTSKTGEIEYILSKEGHLMRMETCPVRRWVDIRLHFSADGWNEIYPHKFRFTPDWEDPGVDMSPDSSYASTHSFGTSYVVSKSGFLTVPIELPEEMVKIIKDSESTLGADEYFAVKFDVLARKGTEWFLVDPRLGVRR